MKTLVLKANKSNFDTVIEKAKNLLYKNTDVEVTINFSNGRYNLEKEYHFDCSGAQGKKRLRLLGSSKNGTIFSSVTPLSPKDFISDGELSYVQFAKNEDGNYSITLNYRDIYEGFSIWQGFKFFVKDSDKWLGPKEYKLMLSTDEIIVGDNPNDPNFKLKLANPKLTLDLNGGNIGGSTDAISFPTNEIQGMYMKDVLEKIEIGYEEPTRDGYIFAGWTYTKDGEDFEKFIPYGIATLYARWIEPVECVLTLNAGEYGYFEVWDEETSSYIQKSTMNIAFTAGDMLWDVVGKVNIGGKVDSDGMYSFNGLYSYNLSGTDIFWAEEIPLTSSLTLYPVMQYNKKVSVTLDANGGNFEGTLPRRGSPHRVPRGSADRSGCSP
jgi:uncharacterized repeat protein (TIGR02543 family)